MPTSSVENSCPHAVALLFKHLQIAFNAVLDVRRGKVTWVHQVAFDEAAGTPVLCSSWRNIRNWPTLKELQLLMLLIMKPSALYSRM